MNRLRIYIILNFLVSVFLISACSSSETELVPPTTIPPTAIPTTEAPSTTDMMISAQTNTPEPLQTETVAPSIPSNLAVINYQTVTQVEDLVAIPLADVIDLEFSPNGQYLRMRTNVSQGNHRDLFLDLNSGLEAFTLEGNQRVYFNPNSTSIASLEGKSLVEYDLRTGEAIAGYTSEYELAALSPDGRWLVVYEEIDEVGPGTTFKVIDISTEEEIHRIFVNALIDKENLKFDSAGELFAGTYFVPPDTYITTFWSIETGKAVHTIYGYSEIAFDPFLQEVAASNAEQNHISLISLNTWEQRVYLGSALEGPNYYNLEYTNYGGMIYALYDGMATYPWFWKPFSGERVYWMQNVDLLDLTISPSNTLMATSDKRGYVLIWGIPE